MKIKFHMCTRDVNGDVSAAGEVSTKKDIIKQFKEFVKNHGTGFNDFEQFYCFFTKDSDIKK